MVPTEVLAQQHFKELTRLFTPYKLKVGLLTGSLVIEQMFSIPGIGSLLTNAINSNDYNVVIGLSFIYSAMYIITMLALDIIYCLIDPRVRLTGKEA